MKGVVRIALAVVGILFQAGCSKEDELLPLTEYENVDVGVLFSYPADNSEPERTEYLGVVHGATACGNVARSYASRLKMMHANWSYVCCTHRHGSDCYEKIR